MAVGGEGDAEALGTCGTGADQGVALACGQSGEVVHVQLAVAAEACALARRGCAREQVVGDGAGVLNPGHLHE